MRRLAPPTCQAGINVLSIGGVSAVVDDASLVVSSSKGRVNSAQVYRFREGDARWEEL